MLQFGKFMKNTTKTSLFTYNNLFTVDERSVIQGSKPSSVKNKYIYIFYTKQFIYAAILRRLLVVFVLFWLPVC